VVVLNRAVYLASEAKILAVKVACCLY